MLFESKILTIAIVMVASVVSLFGVIVICNVAPTIGATLSELEFAKCVFGMALTCGPSIILLLLPVKMARG